MWKIGLQWLNGWSWISFWWYIYSFLYSLNPPSFLYVYTNFCSAGMSSTRVRMITRVTISKDVHDIILKHVWTFSCLNAMLQFYKHATSSPNDLWMMWRCFGGVSKKNTDKTNIPEWKPFFQTVFFFYLIFVKHLFWGNGLSYWGLKKKIKNFYISLM